MILTNVPKHKLTRLALIAALLLLAGCTEREPTTPAAPEGPSLSHKPKHRGDGGGGGGGVYTISDLGACEKGSATFGNDINTFGGQVVVVGRNREGGGTSHAALWKVTAEGSGIEQICDLGALPGQTYSSAYGINDGGRIVGLSYTDHGCCRAVVWNVNGNFVTGPLDLGGRIDFELDRLTFNSEARDVNDQGAVVGWYSIREAGNFAFYWDEVDPVKVLHTLPHLVEGGRSYAEAINELGQIAGYSTTSSGYEPGDLRAVFWWFDGTNWQVIPLDPGAVPGDYSVALGISEPDANGAVWIAGGRIKSGEPVHAALWQVQVPLPGEPVLMLMFEELTSPTSASGVNSNGDAVGERSGAAGGAVRWPRTNGWVMQELPPLKPRADGSAHAIADDGRIAGLSYVKGRARAVLWTPPGS